MILGSNVHRIYKGEVVVFSPEYTFDKTINILQLKIDVQKGLVNFKGKLTIDVLLSSNLPYFIQRTCFRVVLL